jgi:hypothetical protein
LGFAHHLFVHLDADVGSGSSGHSSLNGSSSPATRSSLAQRGDELAAMRSGKDAEGADLLPDHLDVQRIPADEQPPAFGDDRGAADGGVGGLPVADQPLLSFGRR